MTGTLATKSEDAEIVRRHLMDCLVMQTSMFGAPTYSRDHALAALARLERRALTRFS